MTRVLKRVPLDFSWPIGKIWEGYETHKKAEPPTGDGYQMWETTTEGSPKSPVFATLDELCSWCGDNATVYADKRLTAEEWKTYLTDPNAKLVISGNIID